MTSPFPRLAAVLLAMLIGTGAHAEDDKVETANAIYEIRPNPKNEDIKCVFKGKTRLFCIERELVTFGKPVRTRDYTLIPVYDDCGGSACGRSRTTLLIEKGKETKIDRKLKRFCVACQDKFEVKAGANEISIALDRQQGQQFSATFRDGKITIAGKPLDPKEPLSDDDCTYLYEDVLDACIGHQGGVPRRRGRPAGRQCPPDEGDGNRITPPSRTARSKPHAKRPVRRRKSQRALISTSRFAGGSLDSGSALRTYQQTKKPGNARLFSFQKRTALNASRCHAGDNSAT